MAGQRGSILTETLVAAAVLAVALIPIFGSFSLGPATHDLVGRRAAAISIARGEAERLHTLTPAEWANLPAHATYPDPADPTYTVTRSVIERTGVAGLKDVTVTVAWTDSRGRPQRVDLATAVAGRGQP